MKILLVDDHKLMRDGLRAIFEKEGLGVIGEAASGLEAIELAQRLCPEIILMDVSMPDLNGVDATRRIVAALPRTKIIGVSMHADARYVMAMFAAGAVGYLLKNSAADELLLAVRNVANDLTYVSPAVASIVVSNSISRPATAPQTTAKTLSVRERGVLQLLAEGKSSKEIATALEVAVATIETHRRQIMDKLELRTIAELTKYALREGLTSAE